MLSKAYQMLAVKAGRDAGLTFRVDETDDDRAIAVAEDDDASAMRDTAWMDYEAKLRDESFTLGRIVELLKAAGVKVGKSSVARDRDRLRQKERRFALANDRLRAVFDQLGDLDESEMHRKGSRLVMQKLLDFFLSFESRRLEALKPGQVIEAFRVFGSMGKTLAETDILTQRLAEMRKTAKAEVDRKAAGSPDRKLSREDVYAILDDVMKGDAA